MESGVRWGRVVLGCAIGAVIVGVVAFWVAPTLFGSDSFGGDSQCQVGDKAFKDCLDAAKARADDRRGVTTAALAVFAGAISVFGAYITARTFAANRRDAQRSHDLDQSHQITERFTRAIDQLGSSSPDVRLGGIYGLERIARDSEQDHPQVMEVLTAYVREHASTKGVSAILPSKYVAAKPASEDEWDPTEVVRPDTDVQAVLTVLGRRERSHEPSEPARLNLSRANLRGASFAGNFANAVFVQSDLRGADFRGVDVSSAFFLADLRGADFTDAKLGASTFMTSDLSQAVLNGADLSGAVIAGTKFTGAQIDEDTEWPGPKSDAEAAIADDHRIWGSPMPPEPDLQGALDVRERIRRLRTKFRFK